MTSIVWTRNCSALEIFAVNGVALKSESAHTTTDSRHPHNDLPFGPALFEIRKCFLGLIERKHLVNHRLDAPRLKEFANLSELATVWMHE